MFALYSENDVRIILQLITVSFNSADTRLLYDSFQQNLEIKLQMSARCLVLHSGCSIRIRIVESKDFHMFYVI